MQLLQHELDQIQDIVKEIVTTLVSRSAARAVQDTSTQQDTMTKLAGDLAAMGIASGAVQQQASLPHAKVPDLVCKTPLQLRQQQPKPQRVQQVMLALQQNMAELQHAVALGMHGTAAFNKVRYDIGFALGTLVRLHYGRTDLYDYPQAVPDAFSLALQHTRIDAGSPLQLLTSGLAGMTVK